MFDDATQPAVAVLIPCFNEAAAIAQVIADFRAALPWATVFVYDNNSSDGTAAVAEAAGAVVRHEPLQGKGHVVRRMLADVDADFYVLVDGDATYDAPSARAMLEQLTAQQLDLVNGRRVSQHTAAYRLGHRFGNRLFTRLIARLFGQQLDDVLSGYKVMTRRFAKSFPVYSSGFEIETELAVHALTLGVPMAEVDTPYYARPTGSHSKLRALPDGWRILRTIARLLRQERPLLYYGTLAAMQALLAVILAVPLLVEFAHTGLVPRMPTALLCTGIMLTAMMTGVCGVVLNAVKQGQREIKRLLYLQQSN
ncbi:glycosyltransferase family 2 protein [Sinimarinibacterium sp. NLF-5-8]|uniref:glycosyltransferase family 2 protein n=1 Tax=Sinimarinibacterium sp. NLF-5-8 TaxID=2698684 RepID=UPI00137C0E9F|nr:glycosyltransferase family 2 protein [Sinimarinibacterium sp. NLF-5-8]QHS11346.1 glycosyltransferase [Sinimarinibacterium sp. NLF-5-8]